MKLGMIENIDGGAISEGTPVYVSQTVAGAYTTTRPVVPNLAQRVGSIISGDEISGSIMVTIAPFVGGLESGTISPAWTAAEIDISTATYTAATFASLGAAAPNGTIKYCSNCGLTTPATCTANLLSSCVCATGGTGAFARRVNGTWYCN